MFFEFILLVYAAVSFFSWYLSWLSPYSTLSSLSPSLSSSHLSFALVTGASSGIGRSLCKLLSTHRFSLIVIARNGEKLRELEAEIRRTLVSNGVTQPFYMKIIAADLSDRSKDVVKEITEQIADYRAELERTTGKKTLLDILVNNAGVGNRRLCVDHSKQEIQGMIELMTVNLTLLIHAFLPEMIQLNRGRILNVASMTAIFPGGPYSAVYAAVKAYVLSLTKALQYETRVAFRKRYYQHLLRSSSSITSSSSSSSSSISLPSSAACGVNVICLLPGATVTPWISASNCDDSLIFCLPRSFGLTHSPDFVASVSLKRIFADWTWERNFAGDGLTNIVNWILPKLPDTFVHYVCFALWGSKKELADTLLRP